MSIIIRIYKIGLLITTTQLLLSSGCNKNSTSCMSSATTYNFNISSEWFPQAERYSVGDTIFLNSSFQKMLTDQINPAIIVDYSNSTGVGGNIFMYELDSINHQILAKASEFETIPFVGSVQPISANPEKGKDFYFDEQQMYLFKVGFKLKKKGIYLLYVSNCGSAGLRGKNCTKAGFAMSVTNSDKHYSLYQYALQQQPDEIQRKVMYCFRVQ